MYLSYRDFNINKGRLQIESRDKMSVICFISTKCYSCQKSKPLLDTFPEIFTTITFGVINVDKQPQIIDKLKMCNIILDKVPVYMLFKNGVFDRILNISVISREKLRQELFYELDTNQILTKNWNNKNNFITFENL